MTGRKRTASSELNNRDDCPEEATILQSLNQVIPIIISVRMNKQEGPAFSFVFASG
jgi:hypothetical protein